MGPESLPTNWRVSAYKKIPFFPPPSPSPSSLSRLRSSSLHHLSLSIPYFILPFSLSLLSPLSTLSSSLITPLPPLNPSSLHHRLPLPHTLISPLRSTLISKSLPLIAPTIVHGFPLDVSWSRSAIYFLRL